VRSVEVTLTLLQGVGDVEWTSLGTGVAEQSKTTIISCKQACDLFRTDLQRWTRHSDGKLAWQDRANVGFFKKDQIKAMSEQLQNCKLTITNVVGVATLCVVLIRALHCRGRANFPPGTALSVIATSPRRSSNQYPQSRTKSRAQFATGDKQLVVLEKKVEDMSLSDDDSDDYNDDEAATVAEDKAKALRQLEEERKALDASRKLLDELLAKSQEEAVAKAALGGQRTSTTITFGSQNSGVQARVIHGGVNFGK
jgi:hypothetical protein